MKTQEKTNVPIFIEYTQDVVSGYGGRYKCLRCEKGYEKPLPEYDNVKMLISDNVRREYFHNE